MKTILIENMLTGFTSKHAARECAARLSTLSCVVVAEYRDTDNEAPGEFTTYNGFGHCVRTVIEQPDTAADVAYHKGAIKYLEVALKTASDNEQDTFDVGDRRASDDWSEIRSGLDTAIHYHGQRLNALGDFS